MATEIRPLGDLNNQPEEKKKKKWWILILLLLLLIAAFGIFLWQSQVRYDDTATYGEFQDMTEEERQRYLNELQEKAMMDISVTSLMEVTDGDHCLAKIQNKNTEDSKHPWDQKVIMTTEIDGNVETIYESDLIKPGMAIEYVTLDRDMPAGTYDVDVTFEGYNVETHQMGGSTTVTVKMTVK